MIVPIPVTDTLDFCVLNPVVIGGLDISLLLGGNPWRCDCKLAYIKHLQSGPMMVSIIFCYVRKIDIPVCLCR